MASWLWHELRRVDFSCFGYHPYLESRLTIQEKWVLATSYYPTRFHKEARLGDSIRSGFPSTFGELAPSFRRDDSRGAAVQNLSHNAP